MKARLQVAGVEDRVPGDAGDGVAIRGDVREGAHQHAEVAVVRAHLADALGAVVIEPEPLTVRAALDCGSGQERHQPLGDTDRAGPRTTAAVRGGERLVQVEVHHVEAHVAGPRHAHQRVEVGAVVVQKRAASWARRAISRMSFSNTPRVFGLVIITAATVPSSRAAKSPTSTVPSALLRTVTTSSPHAAADAGLVPWALSGMRTRVRWVSPRAAW